MPSGPASAVGTGNSMTAPEVVIRPILLPAFSQNHSVPSAAGAIPIGRLFGVSVSNSMKLPLPGFILPILDVPLSQNQRCWSGPNTMIYGLLCGVGIGCKTISTSAIDQHPCVAEEESEGVVRSRAADSPDRGPSTDKRALPMRPPRAGTCAIKWKCRTAVPRWHLESRPAPSSRFSWRGGHIRPAASLQTDNRKPASRGSMGPWLSGIPACPD